MTSELSDKEFLKRAVRMKWIGTTEDQFEYRHPDDGNIYKSKFDFYWNQSTGAIDVTHNGCNGAIFTGRLSEDGSITFGEIPRDYPEESVFRAEFFKLQEKFLNSI